MTIIPEIIITLFWMIVFILTAGFIGRERFQNNPLLMGIVIVVTIVGTLGSFFYFKDWVERIIDEKLADGASQAPGSTSGVHAIRDCLECPQMIVLPASSFQMGLSQQEFDWAVRLGASSKSLRAEQPQHKVTVNEFLISLTEVTRDQFDAFVRASGHNTASTCWSHIQGQPPTKSWRDPGFPQSGDHPAVCVSHSDAKAYVRWLSNETGKEYRLPSEAEWEYAARAGSLAGRYWGWENSNACRFANVTDLTTVSVYLHLDKDKSAYFPCTDGFAYTAPVARFQPNSFGLYDTIGNVWEHVEDCYRDSFANAPTNGNAWLTEDCNNHVIRGGTWLEYPWQIRTSARLGATTDFQSSLAGFRVARAR